MVGDVNNDNDGQFDQLAAGLRKRALAQVNKHQKLIDNLRGDLEKHGDALTWKRYGDLLLANANNARRDGDRITVIDYFSDDTPEIEIEGDSNKAISEIAEEYFRRYTKARNGKKVIESRMTETRASLNEAANRLRLIDEAIVNRDEAYLTSLAPPAATQQPPSKKKKREVVFKGARRFVSSDGFEILVGKKAKDNDHLTFRIARSLDLWMHAADYPGSHVVVRNQGKKAIPNRTLIEAAELAAFYSDARGQGKAAVHYTQKKFVNKPRRAAAGLVALASFKTILVEPKISVSGL